MALAFDIAGQGICQSYSMVEALRMAYRYGAIMSVPPPSLPGFTGPRMSTIDTFRPCAM